MLGKIVKIIAIANFCVILFIDAMRIFGVPFDGIGFTYFIMNVMVAAAISVIIYAIGTIIDLLNHVIKEQYYLKEELKKIEKKLVEKTKI